jgi:hypothetical protein
MEEKFINIFSGFSENYGQADMQRLEVDPISKKQKPEYRWAQQKLTDEAYRAHLTGTKSIGIQPCNEKNHARFGAIDIDPQEYVDFDRKFYLDKIKEYDLPIIPILSKSGGLHLYIFTRDFIPAKIIRSFLTNLIPIFNLKPETEVFPKQTELVKDSETGEMNKGNFINLPYFKKTERRALNYDGTEFTFEQFIQLVESNFITAERIKDIDDELEKKVLEGSNAEFSDGPPCLAALSKNKLKDGRDRFLYNYMVFAKKKYPDNWEEKVMSAPVLYFEDSVAWSKQKLTQKIRSWKQNYKGYTCNQDPIAQHCMRGLCVKRTYGIASDFQDSYPLCANLEKVDLEPEPEYNFDVTLPDGQTVKSVHCKTIEHLTDQRKRRNSIAKYAGFVPPLQKGADDQKILDGLFKTQKVMPPPVGTTPREKLHDNVYQKITGPEAKNDASFKTGTTLIQDGYAYFKFDVFYKKLKNKGWRYQEDKTGSMMLKIYKDCEIDFLDQKRFPTKEKGKHNSPTKNVVMISIKQFEKIKIYHKVTEHKKDIL